MPNKVGIIQFVENVKVIAFPCKKALLPVENLSLSVNPDRYIKTIVISRMACSALVTSIVAPFNQ